MSGYRANAQTYTGDVDLAMIDHMAANRDRPIVCSNCQARQGEPCTQPTSTGRVAVRWFHAARTDRQAGW